jgi:hypothetical protein
MPNTTTPHTTHTPSTAGVEAVDDAMRSLTQASQNGVEQTKRVLSSTRSFMSDTLALNPQTIEGWATNLETIFKASFGLQNAVLAAAPQLMDANFGAAKSVLEAYTTLAEQQQKILLGAWHRGVKTVEQLAPASK